MAMEGCDLQQSETSTLQIIQSYSNKAVKSLKNSLSYSVNTGNVVNESLCELQSQNEQINRIKKQLNESHETVTLTKHLVEKYVDSLNWISTRIPWSDAFFWNDDSVTLEIDNESQIVPEEVQEHSSNSNTVNDAVNEFSRETTHGLVNLLNEIKSTRTKTSLMSKVIIEQGQSLEKISSSAQTLQERIVNINKMLKS